VESRIELAAREDLDGIFRAQGSLFAILDAAREPAVLAHLRDGGCEHRSLYAGRRGEHLAAVAPYLAQIVPGSKLERVIISEGWGQSWGVLLAAEVPFEEVRRHLRRYLVIETEDARPLSFRFYDPRVLAPFLRSTTSAEARRFFGPIASFFVEEGASALLQFQRIGAAAPSLEAPWDLPKIRNAQMEDFSRELIARFVERMADRLGDTLGRSVATREALLAAIHAGITRARHYGIDTTEEIERYLVVLGALGPGFDERLPWARAVLGREALDAQQKVRRLERRVRQRAI
jgi:Domain of unknown function (DUF4123)